MTSSAELALKQARNALYTGQFAQALALTQPLTDAPQVNDSATAMQIASLALTQQGKCEEAENLLHRLLERDPNNAAAWVNLSTTQEAADRIGQAITSLNRALQIDPDRPAAHFNLGLLYVKRLDWARAEQSFARAIELAPERPEPYYQRAEALIRLNRCAEAQRVLQPVLERHPLLALGWSLMGGVYQKLGQMQQALACYRKAQSLAGDPATQAVAHANIATLIKGRDVTLALQHARRAVALQPDFPGVQAILASVLLDDGQSDEAYEAARRERARHGDDPFTLSLLTRISSERCDWRMGVDQLAALKQTLQAENRDAAIYSLIDPFVLLRFPFELAELRRITQARAASAFVPPQPATPAMCAGHVGKPRPQRLRIGYFSADFYNHATMYLMAGLFEAHDQTRFESLGICLGGY
ncbi:MAG: tetratricopeptide repeat protein, partial [Burkholderiaceae bacterium]|nr:tetratricopeptide repeat protein [Burkholderiaceae bacterium]